MLSVKIQGLQIMFASISVFARISWYFPVNATGMANLLICQHFANLECLCYKRHILFFNLLINQLDLLKTNSMRAYKPQRWAISIGFPLLFFIFDLPLYNLTRLIRYKMVSDLIYFIYLIKYNVISI